MCGGFALLDHSLIQTMFSQPAKRSASVFPADLCTDHAHDVSGENQCWSVIGTLRVTERSQQPSIA